MIELADVFLDNKTVRGKVLQQAFEDCIKNFHNDHIIPFAVYPVDDRPAIALAKLLACMSGILGGLIPKPT